MVGALGSLTLVANTIFAPLIAEEVLTWHHIGATLLIVAGCSVVVAFGPHSNEVYTPAQLWATLTSFRFAAYLLVVTVMGVVLYRMLERISDKVERQVDLGGDEDRSTDHHRPLLHHGKGKREAHHDDPQDVGDDGADTTTPAAAAADKPGLRARGFRRAGHRRAPIDPRSQPPFVRTQSGLILDYRRVGNPWLSFHVHRAGFAVLSALFGAQNVLFGKLLSQIMQSAFMSHHTSFFADALLSRALAVALLFLILLLAVCIVGQLKFINEATERFEALLVLPLYQASWTLLSVTGGMVVQQEWAFFRDVGRAFLFFVGVGLTIAGAALLSQVPSGDSADTQTALLGGKGTGICAGGARKGKSQSHHPAAAAAADAATGRTLPDEGATAAVAAAAAGAAHAAAPQRPLALGDGAGVAGEPEVNSDVHDDDFDDFDDEDEEAALRPPIADGTADQHEQQQAAASEHGRRR